MRAQALIAVLCSYGAAAWSTVPWTASTAERSSVQWPPATSVESAVPRPAVSPARSTVPWAARSVAESAAPWAARSAAGSAAQWAARSVAGSEERWASGSAVGSTAPWAEAAARRREYAPYMFAAVPLHAPVPVLHVLSPAPLTRPPPPQVRPSRYTRQYAEPVSHESHQYAESRPYGESRQYEARPYESRQYESRPYESRQYESRPYAESQPYVDSRPYFEPRPYESHPYVETRPHYESRLQGGLRPFAAPYEPLEYEESASAEYERRPRHPAAGPRGSSEEGSQEVLYARPSLAGGYVYRTYAARGTPPKPAASKDAPVHIKIHKHRVTKS